MAAILRQCLREPYRPVFEMLLMAPFKWQGEGASEEHGAPLGEGSRLLKELFLVLLDVGERRGDVQNRAG